MSDLRTRIAAVIHAHPQADEYGYPSGECRCGWPSKQSDYGIDYDQHVADAVIRELNLEREQHDWPYLTVHRYVTSWESQ